MDICKLTKAKQSLILSVKVKKDMFQARAQVIIAHNSSLLRTKKQGTEQTPS